MSTTQNTNTPEATKPPRSEAQQEAARLNGAKSRGPVSPMGKAISSRNALSHGLTAFHLALSSEDHEAFNRVLAAFKAEYRPQNPTEHSLVEQIAMAQWCIYRAWTAEAAALNVEIETNRAKLDEKFTHFAEPVRTADAIETSLARTGSLPHIQRCNIRATRDFYRALRELRQLRKEGLPPATKVRKSRAAKPNSDFAETNPAKTLQTKEQAASTAAIVTAQTQPLLAVETAISESFGAPSVNEWAALEQGSPIVPTQTKNIADLQLEPLPRIVSEPFGATSVSEWADLEQGSTIVPTQTKNITDLQLEPLPRGP